MLRDFKEKTVLHFNLLLKIFFLKKDETYVLHGTDICTFIFTTLPY